MNDLSLIDRLRRYFARRKGEWVAGGEIERVVMKFTDYTASNARRRLRDLVEWGELSQEERLHNGRNHAFYMFKKAPPMTPNEMVAHSRDLVKLYFGE